MNSFKLLFLISFILAGGFSANFVLAEERIDINTAALEDLVKIIHIGEIRASELISLRPFTSLDDLARIKGIGEKRVEDIKKQGLAWVDIQEESEPEPEPAPEPEPEATSTPAEKLIEVSPSFPKATREVEASPRPITYPSNVVINEILPSPTGSDIEEEWIEVFNQNSFEVGLFGWQITDTVGKNNIYTFPKETTLGPQEFLVLPRPTTKITLNNSGDGLKLIQPDGNIIDAVNYEKAPRGESYNRGEFGWVWSATLTPGSFNIIPEPKEEAIEIKQELATIEEQIPKSSSSSLVLLIGAAVAAFSGIIILTLKKKLKLG